MKGARGLMVAGALGILGAFCNLFYLAQKSHDLAKVEFISIAPDVQINAGDRFKESDFVPLGIPHQGVGNLERSATLYSELRSVVGMAATRSYMPGELILQQDLRTPPPPDVKRLLGENERVLWLPVDTRTFVADLVNPGDQVSFIVPKLSRVGAPPAVAEGETRLPVAEATEQLGPFRILALGNRLGSPEALRAAGGSPTQQNVMAIAVKMTGPGLDEAGQKLSDILRLTNFQQVQVLLHPSANAKIKG